MAHLGQETQGGVSMFFSCEFNSHVYDACLRSHHVYLHIVSAVYFNICSSVKICCYQSIVAHAFNSISISLIGRQKQEDLFECPEKPCLRSQFQDSPDYTERHCLHKRKPQQRINEYKYVIDSLE